MSLFVPEYADRLYTASQTRELDRLAIAEGHGTGIELMQRAGMAAWETLKQTWPSARHIVIVCGAGNNAGDGYIIARLARQAGVSVTVVALTEPGKLKGDAATAAEKYLQLGEYQTDIATEQWQQADVIVDAILGTGLDREVSGRFRQVIANMNAMAVPVLAVDIPSGLNADSGQVMGIAVRADVTVTFIGKKLGLMTGCSAEYRGLLKFVDLDVPAGIYEGIQASATQITASMPEAFLAPRTRTAHKGHYGHALVVGGDYGFAGAVRMGAEAAARGGAGLVSVATRPEHACAIASARPELMATGVEQAQDLDPLIDRSSVIALGPGLGQSAWSRTLFTRVLDTRLPLVLDADALNLLAEDPLRGDHWILTPHPGEAARLLGCSVADIQTDRITAIAELQRRYGGTIILKGAGTLVLGPDGDLMICIEGNPGMASGGMGDVLTGLVVGLLAQLCRAGPAAACAVYIHARAADLCAMAAGERGMLATDLLPHIRTLVNPV